MALERLKPEIARYNLGGSRLWREDLVAIVDMMRQCNPNLTIYADSWKLTDVESDMRELAEQHDVKRIAAFRATTEDDSMSLTLSDSGAELIVQAPDLKLLGAANAIAARTRSHRVLWLPQFSVSSFLWSVALCVCVAPLGVAGAAYVMHRAPENAPLPDWGTPAILVSGLALLVPTFLLIAGYGSRSRSSISTQRRAEAPTFWERKRDDVWISVVSLVVGAMAGYLLGKFG